MPSPPSRADGTDGRTWFLLAGIVLLASALRVWGLDYGLPHPLARPDEQLITNNALRMLEQHTTTPGEFFYPSLQKYLAAGALQVHYAIARLSGRSSSLEEFLELVTIIHPGRYYRTCRLVSVLTGLATVPIVFLLGRRLSENRSVGLIAALLLAVCYLHVRDSHFATVDVTMTFFTTLCLLIALEAARTGRLSLFAAAGLAGGLAAATKYNAAVVCVAIVAAAAARLREQQDVGLRLVASWIATGAAAAVLGFLIGVPYAIRARERMIDSLTQVAAAVHGGAGPTGFEIHLLHSLPGGLGWPLYLAGVAGVVRAAVWRRRPQDWVWLSFALVYFLLIGPARWVVPRYVIPLIPILVVCAAELVVAISARSRALGAAAVLLLALPTLWRSIQYDRVTSRPDTRVAAADWIAAHVPAHSRVALCEGYGAPVLHGNRPGRMPFLPKTISCSRSEMNSSRAAYLVTHEHPVLGWSAPAGHYRSVLDDRWRPVASFDPFSGSAAGGAYYHVGDAFYVPYTGIGSVTSGGPIVTVWERSDAANLW